MATEQTAAAALRRIRERQGRSLRSVASEVGVAPSQLSRLERGERGYSPEIGERLSAYYGLSPEELELSVGRVPLDIVEILQANPEVIDELRSRYGRRRTGA